MAFGSHDKQFSLGKHRDSVGSAALLFSYHQPWEQPLQILSSRKAAGSFDWPSLSINVPCLLLGHGPTWEVAQAPGDGGGERRRRGQRPTGGGSAASLRSEAPALHAEPHMGAQWGPFTATEGRDYGAGWTRTCSARHKSPPAVVFLAILFATTLWNNVFTCLVEDFS